MIPIFIGRERELTSLKEFYEKDGIGMTVIYGRRRIGKSTLITEFVKDKKTIFYTATKVGKNRNLELFSKQVVDLLMPGVENIGFHTTEAVFDFIDKNIYKYRIHEQSLTKQRKLQISMQLMKMRKQYLDNIINMCNNEKYILCSIYCDFMLEECLDNVSRNKLIKAVPEVNAICEGVPSEQIVIYGAGNIGKKAYALYKDSVLYYADQNPLLYGKKINGVEVILPDKISEIQSKFDIVIALSTDKIYSAIKQLEKYNVKKYLYKDINKQY